MKVKKLWVLVLVAITVSALLLTGCRPDGSQTELGPSSEPKMPAPEIQEPEGQETPEDNQPDKPTLPPGPPSYLLPTEDGGVIPPSTHAGREPLETGKVSIERDIGTFEFDPAEIETVRPDIFQPGHFSLFDILVHLDIQGDINLEYHFDNSMDTHIIESINGEIKWWYYAYYSSGWVETNVFRMDMYPYKDGTTFRLIDRDPAKIEEIYQTFRDEVARLERNNGTVVIPEVTISSEEFDLVFQDVLVKAHDIRSDVLQPGVITGMDILLSLLEQGKLSRLKLTWYEDIAAADPVDSYWTEQINESIARGSCGFVYETGPLAFKGFTGSHIHIPSDVRVIVSPEYAFWWWICIGRPYL
jgi:hypothetical protein